MQAKLLDKKSQNASVPIAYFLNNALILIIQIHTFYYKNLAIIPINVYNLLGKINKGRRDP